MSNPSHPNPPLMRHEGRRAATRLPSSPCDVCHRVMALPIQLRQEESQQKMTACLACLRTILLMKSASNEARGVRLLRQDADELGLKVWRSPHVVYLLPPLAPARPLQTAPS